MLKGFLWFLSFLLCTYILSGGVHKTTYACTTPFWWELSAHESIIYISTLRKQYTFLYNPGCNPFKCHIQYINLKTYKMIQGPISRIELGYPCSVGSVHNQKCQGTFFATAKIKLLETAAFWAVNVFSSLGTGAVIGIGKSAKPGRMRELSVMNGPC